MMPKEENSGKLLSDAEANEIARRSEDAEYYDKYDCKQLLEWDMPSLLSDREARIQRNREGIEKMFAKMCELDTPKRGELHLLLISLFS